MNNKKYLAACIAIGLLLCGTQIIGNSILILGCLGLFMLLVAWCCMQDFSFPILMFFLPWSPLLRLSPTSFSFYTFAIVLVCFLSVVKKKFTFKKYHLKTGILICFVTLLSKLLDGESFSFSYIAFLMMLVLFPVVKEECYKQKYDFFQAVVFFSLGAIIASLCALFFSGYSNIQQYIDIAEYSTIIRRSGFYGDPNFYTAQILAALAGALSLILHEKRKGTVVFLGVLILLLFYCGMLSGSKSFVIIAAVIVGLWIISLLKMRGRAGLKLVLLGFFVLAAVYIATSSMFGGLIDVVFTRFSRSNDLDGFTTGRIGIWISYYEELMTNPKILLIGEGFTNVKVNGRGSHNTLIQMIYQFGILGSPVLLYWILCFWLETTRRIKKQRLFNINTLMIAVGAFMPWLAIDLLFFDEFFLLQWYLLVALELPETAGQTSVISVEEIHRRKALSDEFSTVDLKRLITVLFNKAWAVVIVTAVSAVAVLATTIFFVPRQYESSTMFYVNNNDISLGEVTRSINTSDIYASKSLVDTYIVILNTRETLDEVIVYSGVDREYSDIINMIKAERINGTEVFKVVVTSEDPEEANDIANAIIDVLPKRISTIVDGTSAKIVEASVVSTEPSSPNYVMNTIMCLILGFVLSAGFVVMQELWDITIRKEEDVAQICKHPILAFVPDMNAHGKGSTYYGYGETRSKKKNGINMIEKQRSAQSAIMGSEIGFGASEAYKLLRTKLQFSFSADNDCRVIGISSALSGEGKSLTAINLAFTISQLDKKVLLVDCDMRRPTLAEKLGILKKPGLSNYLTRQCELNELIRECGLKKTPDAFHVITAGQNPPNPTELLSSERMNTALNEMREIYDFVILDLPPVGVVSDAMAVAKNTDGMLLIVRQNYCNRISLTDAVRRLDYIQAKILGVVFNCTSEHGGTYYKRYHRRYYKKNN